MRTARTLDEAAILNPGILRHQITWQRKTVTGQNSSGEDVYSWTDVITVRAQVRALTGRELQAAQQRWAEAQYMIRQHYVKGLERVERGSWFIDGQVRYLDILDVQDIPGTGRYLEIIAKEWTE